MSNFPHLISETAKALGLALETNNADGARLCLADIRAQLDEVELDIPIAVKLTAGPFDIECCTCSKPCHSVEGRDVPMCDECWAVAW